MRVSANGPGLVPPVVEPKKSALPLLLPRVTGARAEVMDENYDDRMRRAITERALQPVQTKSAVYTGYEDLIAAARAPVPQTQDTTGIPAPMRAKMEGALGADFSEVRVHPGSARAVELGALAFTQGSDIHVAPGQWAPETTKGQELLGHELGHVLQQRTGRVKATAQLKGVGLNDEPALETEADAMGARAARGHQSVRTEISRPSMVGRDVVPETVQYALGTSEVAQLQAHDEQKTEPATEERFWRVYGGTETNDSDDYVVACFSRNFGGVSHDKCELVSPRSTFTPPKGSDLDCFIRRDGTSRKFSGIGAYLGIKPEYDAAKTKSDPRLGGFGQYVDKAAELFKTVEKPLGDFPMPPKTPVPA